MGWEQGRYYTRSRKVNGRVVREYIGGGEIGLLVAQLDEIERERRKQERERWRREKEEMESFDTSIEKICLAAEAVAEATMLAAGFHCHRGEWRRRRVQKEKE